MKLRDIDELATMAIAKRRDAWDRTAALWSLLANIHRDEDEKPEPYHPADLHPLRAREDYEDGHAQPRDAEEHFQRRIAMLPPEMRQKVLEKQKRALDDAATD